MYSHGNIIISSAGSGIHKGLFVCNLFHFISLRAQKRERCYSSISRFFKAVFMIVIQIISSGFPGPPFGPGIHCPCQKSIVRASGPPFGLGIHRPSPGSATRIRNPSSEPVFFFPVQVLVYDGFRHIMHRGPRTRNARRRPPRKPWRSVPGRSRARSPP